MSPVAAAYEAYVPEGAAPLYAEVRRALEALPDYDRAYAALRRTFHKVLNEQTSRTDVRLVGTFAKLDYLLKEWQAPLRLHRLAHDLRVRLGRIQREEVTPDEISPHWLRDAEALCLLLALLYGVSVPADLAAHFPPPSLEDEPQARPLSVQDCLRLVVHHWDDLYIYGRVENEPATEVCVCYAQGNRNYDYDWTYLRPLLREGTQLNLLRSRMEEGVLYPELLIVDPDYLVDISAVAACFTSYAESPLVGLMNRLMPAETTRHTLLGQLAGQLLDEELHDSRRPYAERAMDFFQTNALGLLTAEMDAQFHSDAQQQMTHIRRAIGDQLPQAVGGYDKREAIVEPSFVSEMLGLQGRMDFLQLDMRVLIEQKSGKAAFMPFDPSPDTPRQREEHYVQMLLYMAVLRYNFRPQYERNGRQLQAFLLYSRYPQSLLGLGFAPELLFRALRLRNRLAVQEMTLALRGFGLLRSLTPDQLNEKGVSGPLWERFVRPRLQQTLDTLQGASPLEQAYCLRMLRFVAAEHQLAKLGNQSKENSGFASLWHDSLEDKLAAGNLYAPLRLLPPEAGDGAQRVQEVALAFTQAEETDRSNFRVGDIVLLYPYAPGTQPDARRGIIFRGTLADITAEGLRIHLRSAQTDAHVFLRDLDKHWAVEHDFMESSFASLYRGLYALLSAPAPRRALLMAQRPPEVDEGRTLRGDYGAFNELALRVKQARDLFLIIGPPGTGKTSFGLLHTLQEELLEAGTNIVLMAYTNRAVDEICSKLHGAIDFIRIGSHLSCAEPYRGHLLTERVGKCRNATELREVIARTRVFVGTTSAFNASLPLFRLKSFSLGIIDEASQILEPHLAGLLAAGQDGEPAIRKVVMIGDHKQLPAVVQQRPTESRVDEPELRAIGLTDCRLSLFERLLCLYGDDPRHTYMLTRQGRMHPDIADFPNRAFYGGRLQAVPLPHQQAPSTGRRVRFIHVDAPQDSPSDKVNQSEADVIADCVRAIHEREGEAFSPQESVGIIVPYRNQIATIRSTIDRLGIPALHGITIDTVERYQGSQRRHIIYGFTIQHHYQLRFLTDTTFLEDGLPIDRKLNVAMTRAEERLTLVGNAPLLRHNPLFARLLDELKGEG